MITLCAVCIIADIVYIISKENNKNLLGLIAKSIAAFAFVLIGYKYGYLVNNNSFTKLILIGLIFDAIGDLFLALRNFNKNKYLFLAGSFSFMIGHIFYLVAMNIIGNDYLLACVIVGIIIGNAVFLIVNKVCKLEKIFIIVGIMYCSMIFLMASMAVGVYLSGSTIKNLIFMIGALFFVTSDVILIFCNFSMPKKWMHPTYSFIYFIAQLLISCSLNI